MTRDKTKGRVDPDLGYFPITAKEASAICGTLKESEAEDTCLAWYERIKDRIDDFIQKSIETNPEYEDPSFRYDMTDEFAEHYRRALGPDADMILKVCGGAQKIVFVLKGGYAMKMSLGDGWMEGEIEVSEKFGDLTCFPRMISRSARKSSTLMECVIEDDIDSKDFERIYGLNMANVAYRCGTPAYQCFSDGVKRLADRDYRVIEFEMHMKSNAAPEWQSLRDLRRYMKQNRPLDDISDHNWGYALRDGKKIPVVFDFDM